MSTSAAVWTEAAEQIVCPAMQESEAVFMRKARRKDNVVSISAKRQDRRVSGGCATPKNGSIRCGRQVHSFAEVPGNRRFVFPVFTHQFRSTQQTNFITHIKKEYSLFHHKQKTACKQLLPLWRFDESGCMACGVCLSGAVHGLLYQRGRFGPAAVARCLPFPISRQFHQRFWSALGIEASKKSAPQQVDADRLVKENVAPVRPDARPRVQVNV